MVLEDLKEIPIERLIQNQLHITNKSIVIMILYYMS